MAEAMKRDPERSDLYAVKDMAEGKCVCPVEVQAIKSELKAAQWKRLACRACRARKCLEELVELSEEA